MVTGACCLARTIDSLCAYILLWPWADVHGLSTHRLWHRPPETATRVHPRSCGLSWACVLPPAAVHEHLDLTTAVQASGRHVICAGSRIRKCRPLLTLPVLSASLLVPRATFLPARVGLCLSHLSTSSCLLLAAAAVIIWKVRHSSFALRAQFIAAATVPCSFCFLLLSGASYSTV